MVEKAKKTEEKRKSIFETLSKIDVSKYVDKKDGKKPLAYLSWASAWGLVKEHYPQANYKIAEFPEFIKTQNGWVPTGRNVDYRQTDAGYEVEATVEIEGEQYSSKLFVMDNRYNAIRVNVSYFDINKTQQRALVKALAFAGLGLNIYAGEDLIEQNNNSTAKKTKPTYQKQQNNVPRRLTNEELKKYTVTINGQSGSLLALFKNAVDGNQSASRWLAMNHDRQTNSAIKQLKEYYRAMENEKKKKQAEEKRKQELEQATSKITNDNQSTDISNNQGNDATKNQDPFFAEEPPLEPTNAESPDNANNDEDVFKALDKFAD